MCYYNKHKTRSSSVILHLVIITKSLGTFLFSSSSNNSNKYLIFFWLTKASVFGNKQKIEEILDFVNQYTDISVTTGLALIETFIDKIECWNEYNILIHSLMS